MKKLLLAVLLLATLSLPAFAGISVGVGFSSGGHGYYGRGGYGHGYYGRGCGGYYGGPRYYGPRYGYWGGYPGYYSSVIYTEPTVVYAPAPQPVVVSQPSTVIYNTTPTTTTTTVTTSQGPVYTATPTYRYYPNW